MIEQPARIPTHPVVWTLVGAIAISYFVFTFLPPDTQNVIDFAFALIPERFLATSPMHFTNAWDALGPLLGHGFLHVAWWHAAGNAFFLFLFARLPALRLGWWRFLIVYFVSSLAGALMFLAVNWGTENSAIGASDAVCGMFTAYFLAVRPTWRDALRDPNVRGPLGMLVILNVGLMGVLSQLDVFPIAWEAHLGGFIGGGIAYALLERPLGAMGLAVGSGRR